MTKARYPLCGILERLADSKRIKLVRMTPQQLIESKIPLDEYFKDKSDLLGSDDENTKPMILIGRNKHLALSYLGHNVGLVGAKEGKLDYHPEDVLVAEGEYRTLVLHARTGSYLGHPIADLHCQLVDKMLLRILPEAFRKKADSVDIGIYDADLGLNPRNLRHAEKLMKELF